MAELNFTGLAETLLVRWEDFVPSWCPGGRLIGREWTAGSLRGGPGDSFKFNIGSGRWADFASDDKGGDMISLYATIQGIKNGEAAKRLADMLNYQLTDTPYRAPVAKKPTSEFVITRPPLDADVPRMFHQRFGEPSDYFVYNSPEGRPIFYEARYDTEEGKQIVPWSWADNLAKWIPLGFPAPRPLYGLDDLKNRPDAPVLLVEGPKCARAAREVVGTVYVPVTWTGGVNAASKTDWAPLAGRKVLIWPDADKKLIRTQGESDRFGAPVGSLLPYDKQPGIRVANEIAALLAPMCPEVKVLDVGMDEDRPDGWDIADAVAGGWTWTQIKEWAKPIARVYQATAIAQASTNGSTAVAAAQANVVVNTSDEQMPDRSVIAILEEYGIATNKNGTPNCNIDNALRALDKSPLLKGQVWFDTFHGKIFTDWNGPAREWSDRDTLELTKRLQRELAFIRLSDSVTFQALTLYAHEHTRNEPRDWMDTLKWDGAERMEEFFINYLGAKDTPYTRAASRNFWIGMCARIFKPGCKMDNMVVLEGPQGTLKSTALARIGGRWFTETNESVSNKDFFLILQGNLLIEIAELHTFSKAEVTRIKQVITCRVDRYRAPYERLVSDHPRQSVFVGSTNEDAYLKDTTGNRRFWPVRCGTIHADQITADREQLFAEAVQKFKAGATWWEMPKDETAQEQEERRQADAWEGMIAEWIANNMKSSFTVSDVMKECLQIEVGRMDKQTQQRVGNILKSMGWEVAREWAHGHQRRVWRKPGADLPLDENISREPSNPEAPPQEVEQQAELYDTNSEAETYENTLL